MEITSTKSLFSNYKELQEFFVEHVKQDLTLGDQTIGYHMIERYNIPLGKAVRLLDDLNNKPFWKKKYYHEHLKDILTNALDQVKVNVYL